MRYLGAFMAAGLWLLALPVSAQPKWAQGQTYSGNIDLGGVQVPLPTGDWKVIAFQTFASKTNASSGTGGDTKTIALAQLSEQLIRAYMVLAYNERSVSNGWTVQDSAQCGRQEIHHARIIQDKQTSKSCQYVNHVVFDVGTTSAQWWKDSVDYVRKNGITMPLASVVGGIVVSDRSNYISANYYFNPGMKGFGIPQNTAWQTSDWNPLNVAKDEKKKSFVQSVIDWTDKSRSVVEAGLAGKLKKGEGLDWPTAMQ